MNTPLKAPLIVSGFIANHDQPPFPGSVRINRETGLIESIGFFNEHADIKGNFLIFPGFVDIHVHGREDTTGRGNHKEDFHTLSAAAYNGGVVAAACMPNTPRPPTTEDVYEEIAALAAKAPLDILLYGGIAHDSRPFQRPVPYKGFLAESVGGLRFDSAAEAKATLRHYSGKHVSLHCDDTQILEINEVKTAHEDRRPAESEIEGIRLAIDMAEEFKFFLKVVHVSTREGLRLIKAARIRGTPVATEGTPHHAFFDRTMLDETNAPWLRMNPPLRLPDDRYAILQGLKMKDVQYLATDHAPHTKAEKLSPAGISGVPHLDTFGAFTTWLMAEQAFEPEDIARVASFNPGAWFNRFIVREGNGLGFGKVSPGFIGSLTLIDMQTPTTVEEKKLKTRCGWSPFTGLTFPGSVAYTIARGEIVKEPTK